MKDKHKGIQEPVITPGESWHLGRMDALQAAAKVVRKYAKRSGVSLGDVAHAVERDLVEMTDASLLNYYQAAGQTGMVTEPPTVIFDREAGVPLLCRPRAAQGGWGIVDMADDRGGEPIVLATPFRAVDLNSFPMGTQVLTIRDPAHSALAVVMEVLECMRRDLDAAAVASSEEDAMHRIGRLLVVYASAASFALNALDEDDFVEWKSIIPEIIDITKAPAAIVNTATKARAQAAVGLQLCSLWLGSVCDNALDKPEGTRLSAIARAVDSAMDKLRPLLDSMNCFISGAPAAGVDHMIVMRHGNGSLPVLAVIPKGMAAATPMREKATA